MKTKKIFRVYATKPRLSWIEFETLEKAEAYLATNLLEWNIEIVEVIVPPKAVSSTDYDQAKKKDVDFKKMYDKNDKTTITFEQKNPKKLEDITIEPDPSLDWAQRCGGDKLKIVSPSKDTECAVLSRKEIREFLEDATFSTQNIVSLEAQRVVQPQKWVSTADLLAFFNLNQDDDL